MNFTSDNLPSIDELKNSGNFKLIKTIKHDQIIEFVLENISKWNLLTAVFVFMHFFIAAGYVADLIIHWEKFGVLMIILSFLTAMLAFFPVIFIHEWIHLVSMRYYGAQTTHMKIVPNKLMVYAYADHFVSRKTDYIAIALGPFIVLNIIFTLSLFSLPPFLRLTMWIILFLHANGCAGDIAIVNFLLKFKNQQVYSFDDHELKESYFFTCIAENNHSNI